MVGLGHYSVRRLPRLVIPYVANGLADEVRAFGEEHNATLVNLTGDPEGYF